MKFREKLNERIGIIKRTVALIEKVEPGHFRRDCISEIPDLINMFANIFLASVVIDGVTGGKSVSYLLTAALIVCSVELLAELIKRINKRYKSEHTKEHDENLKKLFSDKILDLDYAKIEDTEVQNKYRFAFQYAVLEYDAGLTGVSLYLIQLFISIFETVLAVALSFPILFSTRHIRITDFQSFMLSGIGVLAVFLIAAAKMIISSYVLMPKEDKLIANIFTDEKGNELDRVGGYYMDSILNNYRCGKSIRIFGEQKLITQKLLTYHNYINSQWRKVFAPNALYDGIDSLMSVVVNIIIYGFAIFRAVNGTMSAGEVVAFVMYFTRLVGAANEMGFAVSALYTRSPNIAKIFEFFDIKNDKYMGTIPTEKRNDDEYEFEFKHVYFKYPNTEQYVLKDINLKWRIGEKMALVGKNGSGKSTLIKLLCRLYDPTEGEITLNDIDIKKYNYDEYMALFSVVFQDSGLFALSIAENVAASTDYDSERVTDSVNRVGLADRLKDMENGIETYLYKDFDENGVEISGGEAQKLCLARAVYKGAHFVILDEPTAALDPLSEYDIYTKFNDVVGTKTAIYISHRLSSCRFCDDITVLDGGEIAERGTHDSLLAQKKCYADMWAAQAEYYKENAAELFA